MFDELRKMMRDELSLRDRVNAKIRQVYVKGARARYTTFGYSVEVEVIETSYDGKVKMRNPVTGKLRWVDGRSRDLEWLRGPAVQLEEQR
jgi:hypothetical protein